MAFVVSWLAHSMRSRRGGLGALAQRLGAGPVNGRGLLLALPLPATCHATRLADTLRERPGHGLLVNAVRPHRLRIVPAVNISAGDTATALSMLDEGLAAFEARH